MWRMKVSASIQKLDRVLAVVQPFGAHDVALEAHVVGLGGRERREVVRAHQRRRARVERLSGRAGGASGASARARTGSPSRG